MTITQSALQEMFTYREGSLYWRVSRSNVHAGDLAGTCGADGYRRIQINGKLYLEHRLIYMMHTGTLPEFIDHKDGKRENNTVENLRPCTKQENGRNSKGWSKTGVKGVCYYKRDQTYQAQISINGKQTFLGRFSTVAEAEAVVRSAREKYHCDFAHHLHKGNTNERQATS